MRVRVLLRLVVGVVLAGILLAALSVPLLLAPGMATNWLATRVELQSSSAPLVGPVPGNTRVLAADGSVIAQFFTRDRTPVTGDQIAPVMKQAMVDIEDSRFYEHGALDPRGILRAFVTDVHAGGSSQGGSTLTQQLVKQTLVQQASTPSQQKAAIADNLARKLVEARDAVKLEGVFTKDQILTRYLNTVYFGAGAYGIQSAAQVYFSTDAAHLTLPQAATIAGLVQNPTALNPIDHPDAATQRRNEVLTRMQQLGHVSAQELADATAQPVAVQPSSPAAGCANASIGGFFCDYLRNDLINTLGVTQDQLDNGGLTIQTTLRPDLQRAGDQAVVQTLPMGSPLAGIYTVVEPGTGKVLAMSVNRTYGCSSGPQCTSVNLPLSAAAGSGSTYKVFTAASALEQGYKMDFTQTTSDPYVSHVYKQQGGTVGAPYTVINAGHYPPTLNMAEALVMSSNTYFVGLEDNLGSVTGPVQTAQKMGLFSLDDKTAQMFIKERLGSFTLGPIGTSPLALATAYATVFSGGTECAPTPVTAITAPDGRPLTTITGKPIDTSPHCTPNTLPAGVAHTLAQVMRGDVESSIGTAQRANIPGHEIAGKTGTSQNNYSVAFVGSTPEYTGSVMVENPVTAQDVGGFGGDKGAQIWHDAMAPILSAKPTGNFPPADPAYLGGLAQSPGAGCTFQIANLQAQC